MKCPILALMVAVVISSSVQAQDEIVLQRLTKAPESFEETFYAFKKNEALIDGLVIKNVKLDYVAGKSGGNLEIEYDNTTKTEVAPEFVLRLYNPFGICMGGVWVSEENMSAHQPLLPGEEGSTEHGFWIFKIETYVRHGLKGKLPNDFATIAWVSISDSNTRLVPKKPEKKRIRGFELLNGK